jgi:hypothetical protein
MYPVDNSTLLTMGQRTEITFHDALAVNLRYCGGRYSPP